MSEPNTSAIYENLPDNSHKAREERKQKTASQAPVPEGKRVNKAVISGGVKVREDKVRKLTDVFISEDVGSVKSYIIYDVLVPRIKDMFYDIVVNSLDIVLNGGRGERSSRRRNRDENTLRDYNSISRRGRDRDRYRDDRDRSDYRSDGEWIYEYYVFSDRGKAELVLDSMEDALDKYNQVSIGDMYDFMGKSPSHTAYNYGWTDLTSAKVVPVRGGYKIKLPHYQELER